MTIPRATILAGPNGSGKSTVSTALLSGSLDLRNYMNPDLIATGLAPMDPSYVAFAAGRITLRRIRHLASVQENLAFETTLSGRTYVPLLRELRELGYQIHLIFLWLQSEELAVARVAERVRSGGHSIPDQTVRRRYEAGIRNFFQLYSPLADVWKFYDNTGILGPRLVAEQKRNESVNIALPELWQLLKDRYGAEADD